jgi:hypothetical protein
MNAREKTAAKSIFRAWWLRPVLLAAALFVVIVLLGIGQKVIPFVYRMF